MFQSIDPLKRTTPLGNATNPDNEENNVDVNFLVLSNLPTAP